MSGRRQRSGSVDEDSVGEGSMREGSSIGERGQYVGSYRKSTTSESILCKSGKYV